MGVVMKKLAIVLLAIVSSPTFAEDNHSHETAVSTTPVGVSEPGDVMTVWLDAHRLDDALALTALYEADGKHSTSHTFAGRAEILPMFEESVAMVDTFELLNRHLVTQGDYAFETGVAKQQGTYNGTRIQVEGEYVAILAKQDDGSWLIRHLIGGNTKVTPIETD